MDKNGNPFSPEFALACSLEFEKSLFNMINDPTLPDDQRLLIKAHMYHIQAVRALILGMVDVHHDIALLDDRDIDVEILRRKLAMMANAGTQFCGFMLSTYKVDFEFDPDGIRIYTLDPNLPPEQQNANDPQAPTH